MNMEPILHKNVSLIMLRTIDAAMKYGRMR